MAIRPRVDCDCGRNVSVSTSGWPMRHNTPDGAACTAGYDVARRVRETTTTHDDVMTLPAASAPEPPAAPPPVATACADPVRCGRPQGHRGGYHPPGWFRVHHVGDTGPGAWWCSTACFAAAAGLTAPPPVEPARLHDLNRLAGTYLTVMTATPDRVRRALDDAFTRLVDDIDRTAAADRRDRPRPIITDTGDVDVTAITDLTEAIAG